MWCPAPAFLCLFSSNAHFLTPHMFYNSLFPLFHFFVISFTRTNFVPRLFFLLPLVLYCLPIHCEYVKKQSLQSHRASFSPAYLSRPVGKSTMMPCPQASMSIVFYVRGGWTRRSCRRDTPS